MEFEDDPRVTDAQKVLKNQLEEIFLNTSAACDSRLRKYPSPTPYTSDGETDFQDTIEKWIRKSLQYVEDCFNSLFTITQQAEVAKTLVWEAIDEVFSWTGDRSNSKKFEEWQGRIREGKLLDATFFQPRSPECDLLGVSLGEKLNCEFRVRFERKLNLLRWKAISKARLLPPTNPAVVDGARTNLPPDLRGPYPEDEIRKCKSPDPTECGLARARLVGRIKHEIDFVFEMEKNPNELAKKYSWFIISEEKRREKVVDLWDRGKKTGYLKLAWTIAARMAAGKTDASIGAETMKKAWYKYHSKIK